MAYTNMEQIKQMLDKYKFIFLKAFNGSKGQEVASIEQIDELIEVNYFDSTENKLKNLIIPSLDILEAFVTDFFENEQFIIQQGIHLLKFQERVLDLRILLNKNEKGIWECAVMLCRLAPKDKTITNISSGGAPLFYEKVYPFLNTSDGLNKTPSYDEIFELSKKIADYIQREFGLFGEIGLDIALDTRGYIWLIEANAKPDKGIEEDIYDLYGNKYVDLLIESYQKHDKLYKIPYYESYPIYPQVLPPFKYAKFLCNCK
jgi:hypothetical protein